MFNPSLIPPDGVKSITDPRQDASRVFVDTCLEWPANMPGRETGNCCWQWIDDGN